MTSTMSCPPPCGPAPADSCLCLLLWRHPSHTWAPSLWPAAGEMQKCSSKAGRASEPGCHPTCISKYTLGRDVQRTALLLLCFQPRQRECSLEGKRKMFFPSFLSIFLPHPSLFLLLLLPLSFSLCPLLSFFLFPSKKLDCILHTLPNV